MASDVFMNVEQSTTLSGLSAGRLVSLCVAGEIGGTKLDGKWLFRRDDLENWVKQHRREAVLASDFRLELPRRSREEALRQLLSLAWWDEDSLGRHLGVASTKIAMWLQAGVPRSIESELNTLLKDEDALAVSQVVARNIVGMKEDEAWTATHATGRHWKDITGATGVTLDRDVLRVRVVIQNLVVHSATGG